jgi:hypothetical protein
MVLTNIILRNILRGLSYINWRLGDLYRIAVSVSPNSASQTLWRRKEPWNDFLI